MTYNISSFHFFYSRYRKNKILLIRGINLHTRKRWLFVFTVFYIVLKKIS
nr:MAG TPA: hypothetical protein [Caudoviricetes sp.]